MIIGVDPGASGALALYDKDIDYLEIEDIPAWNMLVGKRKRRRVDAVALYDYFTKQKAAGVQLVIIEAVGGRPKQSAGAGFTFGYCVGLIYMACIAARIPIETISPQAWKKVMNVPGKVRRKKGEPQVDEDGKKMLKRQSDEAIIHRADEVFPYHRQLWRGPKGGYDTDKAEAALLAKFGAVHVLGKEGKASIDDKEWRLTYQNADTGA